MVEVGVVEEGEGEGVVGEMVVRTVTGSMGGKV